MLLYGNLTPVQVCIHNSGKCFCGFPENLLWAAPKKGVGNTWCGVNLSLNALLSTFPESTCNVRLWSLLHCLDTSSLNNVWCITLLFVGAPGETELSCDFTNQRETVGRLLGLCWRGSWFQQTWGPSVVQFALSDFLFSQSTFSTVERLWGRSSELWFTAWAQCALVGDAKYLWLASV